MKYIGLVFLFVSIIASGQKQYPTKRQLQTFFKVKLYDNRPGGVELSANNTDSLYFKGDTIKLYNDSKANWIKNFCESVDWDFQESQLSFYLSKSQTCHEPSSGTPGQLHIIKIVKKDTKIVLLLEYNSKVVDKFRVIGLNKIKLDKDRPTSEVLILVRE